jgi:acyl-CoA thioesterase-1
VAGFNALALIGLLVLMPAAALRAEVPVVVLFGDSLTAGLGLPKKAGFAAQLSAYLKDRGVAARIVNSGVSGDTTSGGKARLNWALSEKPDAVVLELGANDALRGVDPAVARRNLDAMIAELKARDIAVLLAGMRAPPNLGRTYVADFDGIFPDLAAKHGVMLYPFFLDGVAARPELNQHDGLHPNEAGVARIVEGIGPYVMRLLKSL